MHPVSGLISTISELASARNLQAVMDIVRLNARELLDADGVTFVLRDGDKCFYAEENAIYPLWKGMRFPMSICISGWVMLHKQSVVIEDIFQDERIPADAYRPTFVKSLAMVPVCRNDPVAAIGAYWATTHRATNDEMDILSSLADAASVTMTNIHLYNEIESQADKYKNLYLETQAEMDKRKKLEKRFLKIYENAALGIVIEDCEGQILQCNPAFCNLLGYSEEELSNINFQSLIHPDDREDNLNQIAQLKNGGISSFETENRYVRKDGQIVWVSKKTSILSEKKLNSVPLVTLVTDITLQKKLQFESDTAIEFLGLINSCRNLKELIHAATDFFQKISGCRAVGIRLKHGHDYPYYETRGFPSEFVQMENKLCTYGVDNRPVLDKNGEPMLACMCGNVICGRFDPTKPFFTEKGSFWSNCTTELLASTTDEERMANTRNRCNGSGYESVALIALRSGNERIGLLQLNDKSKGRFTEETIEKWERLAEYLAVAVSKFIAEDAFKSSEERMQLALDGADLGTWNWNVSSGEIWLDQRWANMLGYEPQEIAHKLDTWKEMVHPEDLPDALESIKEHLKGKTDFYSCQYRMRHKSGQWVRILDRGKVTERDSEGKALRMCGTHLDVSKQYSLEQRVRQMEKMDAIGQLAGGVAHDFNNQLSAIMGYADLLGAKLSDDVLLGYVRNISVSANRSADLTKQLLTFSRKGQYQSVLVDMHATIHEVVSILEHTIDKRIEIRQALNARFPLTTGDPTQFQNMLLNLAINARDAMPEGGVLSFETNIDNLDEEYCATIPYDITPGNYLRICVSDTGIGIDSETVNHIFEPFFTTKDVGKGTGMGLAAVYGTVKHHLGAINVYSEPGFGTTFRLYLPLAENEAYQNSTVQKKACPPLQGLRILVVDDETIVREMFLDILEGQGCIVTTAENGEEAVKIYRDRWQEFDLVIFDIIMPKLDGRDTFREMKKINPNIKTLLSSGYSVNGMADDLIKEGVNGFVQKPFTTSMLLQAISEVIHPKG